MNFVSLLQALLLVSMRVRVYVRACVQLLFGPLTAPAIESAVGQTAMASFIICSVQEQDATEQTVTDAERKIKLKKKKYKKNLRFYIGKSFSFTGLASLPTITVVYKRSQATQ